MSVRGSTGSRRLENQGQTTGHAGEEAESSGSGRGSHQLGTPGPDCSHHKAPWLALPGKAGRRRPRGLGERPPRARRLLTPGAQGLGQRAPTSGQCPPGIGPPGCGRLDFHQLAAGLSRCPELPDHEEQSQGERGHKREQAGPRRAFQSRPALLPLE